MIYNVSTFSRIWSRRLLIVVIFFFDCEIIFLMKSDEKTSRDLFNN